MHFNLQYGIEWLCVHAWDVLKEIGGVAIVTAICAFIAYRMNTHYEKTIEAKYTKEIESLKSQLDTMTHAKNTYFDAEFAIYQELCSTFFELVSAVHWLFPTGLDRAPATGNWAEICQERYRTAQEKYNVSASILGSKAPFIAEEKYNLFNSILTLSAKQIHKYSFSEPTRNHYSESVNRIREEGYEQTKAIDEQWNELLNQLRVHFREMRSKESNNS